MAQIVLLANKPMKISSHSFIQQIQKKLNCQKIGHAGTLDVLASGLMIVLINNGTKLSEFFIKQNKVYQVKVQLFQKSKTGDCEGPIIKTMRPFPVTKLQLTTVLQSFVTDAYYQKPPIYSAVKVQGKKMYQYARSDAISVPPVKRRRVKIDQMQLLHFNQLDQFTFQVQCSKGTYVRTLVEDIAVKLKTYAYTLLINRLQINGFQLEDSFTLKQIDWNKVQTGLSLIKQLGYLTFDVTTELANKIRYGQLPFLRKNVMVVNDNDKEKLFLPTDDGYLFVTYQNELYAVYQKHHTQWKYYKLLQSK